MRLLLILIFIKFSSQLPSQSDIDEELTKSWDALIYYENRLGKIFSDYNKQIQNCLNNLKSNAALKDLTNYLDNLAALVQQQQTVKNFLPYENISTCADINFKIIMLDFEQKKFSCIINQVTKNVSALYGQYSKVVGQYGSSISALGGIGSKNQQNIFGIIQQGPKVISELNLYISLLSRTNGRVSYFNAILSAFKKFYCQCLATVSWTGFNSTLQLNMDLIENQLKKCESKIKSQANVVLNNLKKALESVTEQSILSSLKSLQSTLTNILTASDYAKISWPNINNCNDMWNRLRFLEFKRLQYVNIIGPANLNSTYCAMYQSNANSFSNSQLQLTSNSVDFKFNFNFEE